VVAFAVVTPAMLSTSTETRQLPDLADAPPGTIFQTVLRDSGRTSVRTGVVKRGDSGPSLFNPTPSPTRLTGGDVLVDRRGTRYLVDAPQDLRPGSGTVGPRVSLYAGEAGLRYTGFGTQSLVGAPGGGAAGWQLDLAPSIPGDQRPGVYRDADDPSVTATVGQGTVSGLVLFNQNGASIDPEATVPPDGFVIARADVNFLDAEPARIAVLDPATGRAVTAGALTREEAMTRYPDFAGVIARTVPPGKASPVGPDATVRSLANPANERATTIYLIQDLRSLGGPGEYEVVAGGAVGRGFGDLDAAGVRQSVPLRVDTSRATPTPPEQPVSITIEAPTGTYTVGRAVAVEGTADPTVDAVAVYVRGDRDWELLGAAFADLPVDEDRNWASVRTVLSRTNDRLGTAGPARIGAVAVADADTDADGRADARLSAEVFRAGRSVGHPLLVTAADAGANDRTTTVEEIPKPETTSTTTTTETVETDPPDPTTPTETTVLRPTTADPEPETTTASEDEETTPVETPGLGVIVAFLAIVVAILLATRRE
jgi:hypothetical protein